VGAHARRMAMGSRVELGESEPPALEIRSVDARSGSEQRTTLSTVAQGSAPQQEERVDGFR